MKAESKSMTPIEFRGDSLDALRRFTETARRRAGHQLDLVQRGNESDDWKPMDSVGNGVREIRVKYERGIFRVLYVTKFGETIFVLHCFQKKTQKTSRVDLETAERRYKELRKEHSQ
jgi:phage-related protein